LTDILYRTKANAVIHRLTGKDLARKILIGSLAGIRMDDLDRVADSFVANFLPAYKIEKTFLLLELIRQTDAVELCSATLSPVAAALERALNVRVISSELEAVNGICTGRLEKDLLGRKHEVYSGKRVKLVVTDNTSDLELIRQSERSFVISPRRSTTKFWNGCDAKNIVIF
jgi:phosphoserine phosphatase